MSAGTVNTAAVPAFALEMTRTFDAPRELVWRAWTDPAMVVRWFGPRGFSAHGIVFDLQPGGRWQANLSRDVAGEGCGDTARMELTQLGKVREALPPELLVYTFCWQDRSAAGLGPSPYEENIVTLRFTEPEPGKTVLHFHQSPFATEAERDSHGVGWASTFDRLGDLLYFALQEQWSEADVALQKRPGSAAQTDGGAGAHVGSAGGEGVSRGDVSAA